MAAASTSKSVQHTLESLVTGASSTQRTSVAATIPTAAVSITGVVDVAVPGAAVGDIVLVGQTGAIITGVGAYGGFVKTTDVVTLWALATTGGYTGASRTYNIILFKQS